MSVAQNIKEKGSCIDFVEHFCNVKVKNNRCPATWRNGSNPESVSIEKDKWFDHAENKGGDLINLCNIVKFNGNENFIQTCNFLCDYLNIPKFQPLKKDLSQSQSRYNELIAQGYKLVKTYDYKDENGIIIHSVLRLEHPEKEKFKKQFLQSTPNGWGLQDTQTILYNLQAVINSDYVIIVEGEKDVDSLTQNNLIATTLCGGAKKWDDRFIKYFQNKHVFILPDNDKVGLDHAQIIAEAIADVTLDLKILTVSKLPKGDVTDYLTKEGGNALMLCELLKNAPTYAKEFNPLIASAKTLNKEPLNNAHIELIDTNKGKKQVKNPKQIREIIAEIRARLLNAPFKVGDTLFDQDKDTKETHYLYDETELFTWIGTKTNFIPLWERGNGYATRKDIFNALRAETKSYDAISFVPDYPMRKNVFYAHSELPAPSENHKFFWDFISFFNPADEVNRLIIAAFVIAPIFYLPKVDKPLWIIDSIDGQGSGKSTLPFMTALLYGSRANGGDVIDVSLYDLDKNYNEIVKRLISPNGRNSRIFLLDNVKGILNSSNLAKLVTSSSISGRPAYGRGEEVRQNNLNYVVTVNSAIVDTDIASRAFYIMLKKPKRSAMWKEQILSFIEKYRYNVFADIIDLLAKHQRFDLPIATRTPEFETKVLQAVCQNVEPFMEVINFLNGQKEETNSDEELARRIEEDIIANLAAVAPFVNRPEFDIENDKIFIRSNLIEEWLNNKAYLDRKPVTIIRNLAQTKMLSRIAPNVKIYPHNTTEGIHRRNGIMWNYTSNKQVRIVGLKNNKPCEIIKDDL